MTMPSAATAQFVQEGNFEQKRKLDSLEETDASRSAGAAPPNPYESYAIPYEYRYREPPSMPYARGHPGAAPQKHHPHGPHPGYAYPTQKEYYEHSYHAEYPPPGWGGHLHYHLPSKASGQPFSSRYGQPYEFDRHYAESNPAKHPKASSTNANTDGTYPSPISVVNTVDTRSPEGSRNLNNFEERVGQTTAPPSHLMPYPHHQTYYTSIHSPVPGHAPPHTARQWWSCNFCSYKFSTWEECSGHESICPNASCKKRRVDTVEDCHFLDPREEYANNTDRPVFSLALPADGQSLSDRQCYVRTHFVELFVANEADVSARHSRGAQKLHLNQVGLRCAYCAKLKPRDRAERAVCYPSSISRIYQTVADMQRFHFETCIAIPPRVLRIYKSLKTTRPRGVGSPQSYWDKSARELGLMDSDCGIVAKDSGILVQKKMEEHALNGAALIPTLTNRQIEDAGSSVENSPGDMTPREEEEERNQTPSEADASILLMLKNPEAASPKSDEGGVTAQEVPEEVVQATDAERSNLAEV